MGLTAFMAALLGLASPVLVVAQPKTTFSVRLDRISSSDTPLSVKLAFLAGSTVSMVAVLTFSSLISLTSSLVSGGVDFNAITYQAREFMAVTATSALSAIILVFAQLTLESSTLVATGLDFYRFAVFRILSYMPYATLYAVEPPKGDPLGYAVRAIIALSDPIKLAAFTLSLALLAYGLASTVRTHSSVVKAVGLLALLRLSLALALLIV